MQTNTVPKMVFQGAIIIQNHIDTKILILQLYEHLILF